MGTLTYRSSLRFDIDDRPLAHLQVVIWSKLRRLEPFSFTEEAAASNGVGRVSVWLTPNVPLTFDYFSSKPPSLNRLWIEALAKEASSPSGLVLVPEPLTRSPRGDG